MNAETLNIDDEKMINIIVTLSCCKCKLNMSTTEFYPEKKNNRGFTYLCKKCSIKKSLSWMSKNKEKYLARRRFLRTGNSELKVFKFDELNNTKICGTCRVEKNKTEFLTDKRTNKPGGKCFSCRQNTWLLKKQNTDFCLLERKRLKAFQLKKRSTPQGRISGRMSNAIWYALKQGKSFKSWEKLVGYSTETLKNHLESNFTSEMNWDLFMNGEIHIDHKIPQSWFKYESYDDLEFKKCWSLENLQPKFAVDNLRKNASYAD